MRAPSSLACRPPPGFFFTFPKKDGGRTRRPDPQDVEWRHSPSSHPGERAERRGRPRRGLSWPADAELPSPVVVAVDGRGVPIPLRLRGAQRLLQRRLLRRLPQREEPHARRARREEPAFLHWSRRYAFCKEHKGGGIGSINDRSFDAQPESPPLFFSFLQPLTNNYTKQKKRKKNMMHKQAAPPPARPPLSRRSASASTTSASSCSARTLSTEG